VHHPEAKYYAVRGEGAGEGNTPVTKAVGRAGDTTGAAA
jgi:hypothetical protein